MPCMQPPEPDDADLLAFLDGEDRPEVEAHLRVCPHCRDRSRELAALDGRLAQHLFRAVCPTSLQLGEYVLETADREVARSIRQHLKACPHCQAEVAQLRAYLLDLEPEIEGMAAEGVVGRVRRLVAQWVSGPRDPLGSGLPSLTPAMAGVRGEGSPPLVFRAAEFQIALESHQERERQDLRCLYGLLTGADTAGLAVSLWQNEQRVVRDEIDDLGGFALSGLLSGAYRLVIDGPDIEIEVPRIEV